MWEYTVQSMGSDNELDNSQIDGFLNSYGREGWELINVYCAKRETTLFFIFKREVIKM